MVIEKYYTLEHGDNILSEIRVYSAAKSQGLYPLILALDHQVHIVRVSGARAIRKSISFQILDNTITIKSMVNLVTNTTLTHFIVRK